MDTQNVIYKNDGKPFKAAGHAKNAIRMKKLTDTYEVMALENGGYVGVPKPEIKDAIADIKAEQVQEESLGTIARKPIEEGSSVMPSKLIKKAAGKKTKRVRVHWAIGDDNQKELPISVCVNTPKNRIRFNPGEEVELTTSQIGVLRDAIEENELVIPPDSGIYAAKDPLSIARNQYPGMRARYDNITGQIKMTRRVPHYLIEYVHEDTM